MLEVAPPRPGRKLWKRYAVGIVLIIVAVCAATSVAAYNEVDNVVHAFQKGGTLRFGKDIAEAPPGKPQTILLIGSDHRAKGARDYAGNEARSDTLILVRLDPRNKRTAMLSIPRDLKVTIPGRGEAKINEAYTLGGAALTLKTIKQLTGLSINHVVNVDFGGFREAVNAVHCVYVDIDRRYYNANAPGADQYATINIQPGYQKLCGQDALDYVRYRHTDTDIIRAARQQDFIRQAKAQVGVGKILSDRKKLTKIFGDYTQSDLHARSSILRLLTLVGQSAKNPIVQIPFKGELGPSFVEASPQQMRSMVAKFLGPSKKAEKNQKKRRKKKPKGQAAGLSPALDMGRQQALQVVGGQPRLPVYYPTQVWSGAQYVSPPRVYNIPYHGRSYSSYRMVVSHGGDLKEYYGLQGTTWKNPPILQNPDEKLKYGGREFELYYDGDRVRVIAWRTGDGVYWITNTLLQKLSKAQMVQIARTTKVLGR
jgi:polyisoprenyl-teichoic acid--peptidoglycan teichoic acid transferase